MPAILASCQKCGHRIVIDLMDQLPPQCPQPQCDSGRFYLKRLLPHDYKLTKDDTKFLKALRIQPS